MRPFIRTSHEQRKRSSIALQETQLQHLTAVYELSQRRGSLGGANLSVGNFDGNSRRASCIGGGGDSPWKSPADNSPRASISCGGSSRRPSMPPTPSTHLLCPPVATTYRRRSVGDVKKPTPARRDEMKMDIKVSNVILLFVFIAGSCIFVVLLSYFIKTSWDV